MSKKTKIIITAVVLIAAAVGAILFVHFSLKQDYSQHSQKFADGSAAESDGSQAVHTLFDEYAVTNSVRDYFGDAVCKRHFNGISYDETYITEKWCYIERYAFDKNGYIAYYCYVPAEDEDLTGENAANIKTAELFDKEFKVKDMYAGLYDCNNEKEMRFDTFDELLKYAKDNSINLGTNYKISRFGVSEYQPDSEK